MTVGCRRSKREEPLRIQASRLNWLHLRIRLHLHLDLDQASHRLQLLIWGRHRPLQALEEVLSPVSVHLQATHHLPTRHLMVRLSLIRSISLKVWENL